jgi:hypothetical protein
MALCSADGVEVAMDYGWLPMPKYMAHITREIFITVQVEDREVMEVVRHHLQCRYHPPPAWFFARSARSSMRL